MISMVKTERENKYTHYADDKCVVHVPILSSHQCNEGFALLLMIVRGITI